MAVNYYLTVFPMEALIASELDSEQFGAYITTGINRYTAERSIFLEISEHENPAIDWNYAKSKCVSHSSGQPKHSLYLSIYQALESIPLSAMGSLYLANPDGTTLKLEKKSLATVSARSFFMYQELCPISPLVVSNLTPQGFASHMTNQKNKVSVPKLVYALLKNPNLDDQVNTGNVGTTYEKRMDYLKSCIDSVIREEGPKPTKAFSRSHIEFFTFQVIDQGVFIADGTEVLMFAMPLLDAMKNTHYDWAKSANII